jgi:hypothetical protein
MTVENATNGTTLAWCKQSIQAISEMAPVICAQKQVGG